MATHFLNYKERAKDNDAAEKACREEAEKQRAAGNDAKAKEWDKNADEAKDRADKLRAPKRSK